MTEQNNRKSREDGVSESIGFLLIFAIIITGIGLVTLYGYPMLMQQQVSADEKIMEKNMIVLQNDIKSLAYKTVPYKETSLKIGSGTLTVYDSVSSPSSTLNIYYGNSYPTFKSGELRFESPSTQTDISLQNGAVVMRPRVRSGSTMLAEPRWIYDENPITHEKTMVITLINITSDTNMARDGIGTVRMKLGEPKYFPPDTSGGTLKIGYNPESGHDYSVAWGNYFTKLGMTYETLTDTYTIPVDKLLVKIIEIQIESI